ncbi:hypothetical protein V8G54_012470 [Vigna mungo]|uniref:Uncharacterized protein n=1 Tax=Vigna mungo TaxID=3915 RepID=A0AAQ3S0M0_VIGMU
MYFLPVSLHFLLIHSRFSPLWSHFPSIISFSCFVRLFIFKDGVGLLGLDRKQGLETNLSRRETRMPRRGEADRVIPNPQHDGLRPWVWWQRRFRSDNGVSTSFRWLRRGVFTTQGSRFPAS